MSGQPDRQPTVVERLSVGHTARICDTKNLQLLKTSIPVALHEEIVRRSKRAGITYDQWFSLALAATLPALLSSAALDVIAHHWHAAQWPQAEDTPLAIDPPGAA